MQRANISNTWTALLNSWWLNHRLSSSFLKFLFLTAVDWPLQLLLKDISKSTLGKLTEIWDFLFFFPQNSEYMCNKDWVNNNLHPLTVTEKVNTMTWKNQVKYILNLFPLSGALSPFRVCTNHRCWTIGKFFWYYFTYQFTSIETCGTNKTLG